MTMTPTTPLTVLRAIPDDIARELTIELSGDAVLQAEGPDGLPEIVLNALQRGEKVLKIEGPAIFLVGLLDDLAATARAAYRDGMGQPQTDASAYDLTHVGEVLRTGTWFTARLYQLLSKSDPAHRERLRMGFPDEVRAFERWERQGGDEAGR